MPIEVDLPDGSVAEFPDGTSHEVMKTAISKRFPSPAAATGGTSPTVPFYQDTAQGEVNVNANPQVRSQFDAAQKAQDEAKAKQEADFAATRTLPARVRDTATFAASVPVRAATRGEYGIGDVFGLANEAAGKSAKQSEANFAQANESGLEVAKNVGDVMAGVPMLNTMGAVPGQVLRTGSAAVRQLPGEMKALLKGEEGSGPLPGGPAAPPPPTVPPAATPPPVSGIPNKAETLAAADRLKQGLDANLDVPEMVVGGKYKQGMAAGLKSIPMAGEPVEMAYEKGLKQLGTAKEAAGGTLGQALGSETTGGAVKQGALSWIRKNSKEYLNDKYAEVASSVDQNVTRPLTATMGVVDQLEKEMKISTVGTAAPAIRMVESAISRPEGLSAKGLADLRSAVGRQIDAAKTVPDAAEAAYKRLYGALDKDLQETLKTAGGDKALGAWQTANREAKIIAGKRKRIAQVIGSSEEKLSDEAVFNKIQSIASDRTANFKNLRQIREVIGDKDWGNVGAELVNRLGIDPKTGLFSTDRYLTAYGKMTENGKSVMFGAAKPHLDDIALISRKFGELSGRFNRSNTGVVNAVLKFINNPATMAVHAVASPLTAVGQVGGLAAGRSMAWSLARPANAQKAANVMRAYYRVARAGDAAAKYEPGLASAVRTFAQGVAAETGQNADDVANELSKRLKGETGDL